MRPIYQTISVIIAIFLYIGATDYGIVSVISNHNFYLTYMGILYLIFLANILFFYGFYKLISPFKDRVIIFKSILWSLFVIIPFLVALLYGTYFNSLS